MNSPLVLMTAVLVSAVARDFSLGIFGLSVEIGCLEIDALALEDDRLPPHLAVDGEDVFADQAGYEKLNAAEEKDRGNDRHNPGLGCRTAEQPEQENKKCIEQRKCCKDESGKKHESYRQHRKGDEAVDPLVEQFQEIVLRNAALAGPPGVFDPDCLAAAFERHHPHERVD